MPSTGDLIERVRFESRAALDDGAGNEVSGPWTAQFERWAVYIMRPGNDAMVAARLQGQQPVTVIVRFDEETKTSTADWRLVDVNTGRIYEIKSAEDMDRTKTWWSMVCIEGAAA